MKRIVAALVVLASMAAVAVAQGVVVQAFSFQIKDVKTWGGFTVVFSSRSYDTSGGIPAALDENYIRLPKGAAVPKVFRNKRFYCNAKRLVDKVRMEKGNRRFMDYMNKLLKGKKTPPKSSKDLISVCRFARIGTGRVIVDARPFAADPIPADLVEFWAKPPRGAVAALAIAGIPDDRVPIVRDNPTIRETVPVVDVVFYRDPTPDGVYDYKVVLPTGPIAGIRISVAEVKVTMPGMTLVKKTKKCTKKRRGKCAKRKTRIKRTFWFTAPLCSPSGKLSFEAFYGYAEAPDQTKTIQIPCPDFG